MISAIISTYNREKFLPDLFKSIQNQSLDSNQFEIIIVDNNSPVNTKELSINLKKRAESVRNGANTLRLDGRASCVL